MNEQVAPNASPARTSAVHSHFLAAGTPPFDRAYLERHAMPFAGAYLITLVVYSYFFSTLIFTDHTFPSVWVIDYPSYKTTSEGRWFGDMIWRLVGGSGVQAFQMGLASGIQIINAFLFAAILGVSNRLYLFLVASFLALHPAFLDYYSFGIEHLPFTLGDTLALLGILSLERISSRRFGLPAAILCFVLSLATYQPKIAFIALLLLIWCIQGTSVVPPEEITGGRPQRLRSRLLGSRITLSVCAFVAAVGLYYISVRLLLTLNADDRTHLNDLPGMLRALLDAYPIAVANFTTRVDYLPRVGRVIPMFGIMLGVAAIVRNAWRAQQRFAVYAAGLLALFPAALQLSYVINEATYQDTGRLVYPYAYALLFFLVSAWSLAEWRRLATFSMVALVYSFCVVGSQEANYAALKNVFDIEKINRIVARVESVAPDLYGTQLPVVVVGELRLTSQAPLRRYPNTLYGAHITRNELFEVYRHTEILNFFLGNTVFVRPSTAQAHAALASLAGRRPWPAPESVYLHDGVLVVLLQAYHPEVGVTWTDVGPHR